MWQKPFFWSSPEFGGKIPQFRTETELVSLPKLCKKVSPPWNLLNQQKIDTYN